MRDRGIRRTICVVIIAWSIFALCVYVMGLAIWCSASDTPLPRLWYITAYRYQDSTLVQYGSGDNRAYIDITANDNAGAIRYVLPYAITIDGQYYTVDKDKFPESTIKWYDKSNPGSMPIYDGTILSSIPASAEISEDSNPSDDVYTYQIVINDTTAWHDSIYYTLWTSSEDKQGWIYIDVILPVAPMPDNEVLEYLRGDYNNPAINPAITGLETVAGVVNDYAGDLSGAAQGFDVAVNNGFAINQEGLNKVLINGGQTVGNILKCINSILTRSPVLSALVLISICMLVGIAILRKSGD